MIHGIGIDTVEISRFKRAMDRWGDKLINRLFTPAELAYCLGQRSPERHLSARFAAKVSFFKALGRPVNYQAVEVARDASGAPTLVSGAIEEDMSVSVSISHDGDLSIAQTIIERAS